MEVRQKFEKYIDIQKTIDYCHKLCMKKVKYKTRKMNSQLVSN